MRPVCVSRSLLIGFLICGLAACGGDDVAPRVSSTPQHPGADAAGFATALREVTGKSGKYDVTWRADSDNPLGADQIPFTGDDAVLEYTQFEDVPVSAEQQTGSYVNSSATYVDTGPDGLWFTEDDIPREYAVSLGNDDVESRWSLRALIYGGPGIDTVWFTDDDELQRYVQVDGRRPLGETIEFSVSSPGEDGLWLTEDDPRDARVFILSSQVDEQGLTTRRGQLVLIGADGAARTDDDVTCWENISKRALPFDVVYGDPALGCDPQTHQFEDGQQLLAPFRVNADSSDSASRTVYYNAAGPDGLWRTDDDTVSDWSSYERGSCDGLTCVATSRLYGSSGPDGQWFTADDIVVWLSRSTRKEPTSFFEGESRGGSSEISYRGPGADGEWGTTDDQVSEARRAVSGLFGGDEFTTVQLDGLGADNLLGTQDDPIRSYTVRRSTFVTEGDVTYTKDEVFTYTGAGVDGVWLTLDDELEYYSVYYLAADLIRLN